MLSELEVLKDVCGRLDRVGIAYMLTGSVAMNYYAQPRMTRDIDLVVEIGPGDAARVRRLFEPDYYVLEDDIEQAVRVEGMFNLVHLDSIVKVDVIVRKNSEYRKAEFARRREIELPGFRTRIVAKEDLILSKLAWAKDDTSPEETRFLRERYARLSGAQRLVMGAEMFETARTIAEASLPKGLSERDRRRRLCERFYGELGDRIFGSIKSPPHR